MEQNNLIHKPSFASQKLEMQTRLYEMMAELGGMQIPLNAPRGRQQNKRLRSKGTHGLGGEKAADFPEAMMVDEPLRRLLK
jgi:N-acetylglucosamine-6-sulfatase